LSVEDIIGLKPGSNRKLQAVLDEIKRKTGWSSVKKKVEELVTICDKNYELELQGEILHKMMKRNS
jgi:hypothetical protein